MWWFDRFLAWVRLPPDRDPDRPTQRWVRKRFRRQLASCWFRWVVGWDWAEARRVARTLSLRRVRFRLYRNPLCGFAGLLGLLVVVALPGWSLPGSGRAVAAHELHHYARDYNETTRFLDEAGMGRYARWWEEIVVYTLTLVTCPVSSAVLLSYCAAVLVALPVGAYHLSQAFFALFP